MACRFYFLIDDYILYPHSSIILPIDILTQDLYEAHDAPEATVLFARGSLPLAVD